jgi:hypothetical protein
MEEMRIWYRIFVVVSFKGRDHSENLGVDDRILKIIFEK